MNKKVFLITIYYILGTIGGLYFNNIILFLILLLLINCCIFKKDKRKFILLTIICIIAFSKTFLLVMHTRDMENVDKMEIIGDIEQIKDGNKTRICLVNVDKLNGRKLFFNTKIKVYIKNNQLIVGDRVSICGKSKKTVYTKNDGCFNYKRYLYSKEIYLNMEADSVKKEQLNIKNYYLKFINSIQSKITDTCQKYLSEKNAGITLALIIGNKNDLDEDVSSVFSDAGLSHLIAISGMHTVYVAYIALIFKKLIGKRNSYYIVIIVLFIFCNITNNSESVYRACIMLSLFYLSKLFYSKSNSLSNLFISIILGLIKNPYSIYSPGFILSTAGTFGIITVYEQSARKKHRVKGYIIDQIKLGISANVILIPIVARLYNKVSLIFLISSCIVNFFMTILMPAVFTFGIMGILNNVIPKFIFHILAIIVELLTSCLLLFAELFSKFTILNIQVETPSAITIVTYYLIIFILFRCRYLKKKYINDELKKYKSIFKIIICLYICMSIVFRAFVFFDRNLKIYFVDVGQGDCTLIETPEHQNILIDGGGSEDGKKDNVGEKIVVPFLLNKHIKKLDYIIISHFDSDHVGGILTVMEKIKVKNVIISKQGEDCDNYRKFRKLVKEKKINVIFVEKGKKINMGKDVYFEFLWPEKELISENILNNNSIVCKLNYNNFSMLFTGDIEEIAENRIVELYKNNKNVLNSTCLKAGHHGSRTSSTNEFLKLVKPNIVLIGVGVDNKFGHPNEEVIERYKNLNTNIYRTDYDGEIVVKVNKKGEISIKKSGK